MRQLKINKSITNRDSDSLEKYLSEITRENLLTVDEEVELAQRIREGDRKALDKLKRYVKKIVDENYAPKNKAKNTTKKLKK